MTEADALGLLRTETLKAGGQAQWAREHCLSNQYVSDILTGKAGIGPSVQAALGIRRIAYYEKIGEER